ncbi:MAG: DUF2254 family protein [Tissierellia bacterium]|nr:DUF2254 family protein [Tissierellia bacterium]
MIAKVKLWFINNKNLVKISTFTLLSMVLLFISWLLDHRLVYIKDSIPDIFLLPVDVSINFLSNLSGVFLTISIFALTTIITVINKYTSSFTPRMAQDFMDRADVLTILGIFVGGFFYSIISLFNLQNIDASLKVVSGTIGIIYSIVSMIGFVIFAQRILYNLKTSNVIENVYKECKKLIEVEIENRRNAKRYKEDRIVDQVEILALETGYLFEINYDGIMNLLDDFKGEFVIAKRIGEYIPEGACLANINFIEEKSFKKEELEELKEGIAKYFIINVYKNDQVDYHHEIIKITEMALMALSPGINDPNTAIICINKLSNLLGKLFSTGNQYVVVKENKEAKIIYQNYSVKEELYLVFSQIVACADGDPMVSIEILEGLYLIYMLAGMGAKSQVKEYFDSVYDILMEDFSHDIHKEKLKEIKENLEG